MPTWSVGLPSSSTHALIGGLGRGVGLTTVFGAGAMAFERLSGERGSAAVRDGAIIAAAGLACAAGVVLGLYAITHR